MAKPSMSAIWDETTAFVRAEAGLLFPLAFATIGLAMVLFGLLAPVTPDKLPSASAVVALLPLALLLLTGQLAISAITLLDRASVAEALAAAFRRLPMAVLANLTVGIVCGIVLVLASLVVAIVGMASGASQMMLANIAAMVAAPAILWLFVRILPVQGAIVVRPPAISPLPALREAFAITSGSAGRIAGAALLFLLAYLLITVALQFALGSVLLIIGRAIGSPGIGSTLAIVVAAAIGSSLQAVWTVFTARLYRALSLG
ncbi:hypothetical protein ABC347_16410 [Sphingomonas sp. 1P06PA]|uniref:hypothetical protein n=1 Tax=Sphingomonas sp. 1P06PA TaxID=554121 RepID=UPI0039A657BA